VHHCPGRGESGALEAGAIAGVKAGRDGSKLREPVRALRVMRFVSRWVKDSRALSLEEHDRRVLEAAGG